MHKRTWPLCRNLSDLGGDDNQMFSNFIDSVVNRDQVSDLDSKRMVHSEAQINISTDNEHRKYNQDSSKTGEAKDTIDSLIGDWTLPDEWKKYGHQIEGESFLSSSRQNVDAIQHCRENSDHYSSPEGLLVISHTGKAQGSNSSCDQSEIFTVPTLECSVDVVEHSFLYVSRVLQTAGVSSLAFKIPSGEKLGIYKGKGMSMERKEVQGAALTVDVREGTQTNANFHSSTSSVCGLQFGTNDPLHMALEDLSAEVYVKHDLEQSQEFSSIDFPKTDILQNNVLCNTADNCGQEGILSSLGVESDTTTWQKEEIDTEKAHSKAAAPMNAKDDEPLQEFLRHELEVEDAGFLDDLSKKHQPSIPTLMRNVTLEEATDMILFCSSIVHEIAYKAAEQVMQMEDHDTAKNSGAKRKPERFFNFSEAMCRNPSYGDALRPGNWKWQPPGLVVRRTFRYVQKQRMVHQQTPTVTVQENLMGRTENAVMGNHEEILTHTVKKVHKRKSKQGRKSKCRCRCTIM